ARRSDRRRELRRKVGDLQQVQRQDQQLALVPGHRHEAEDQRVGRKTEVKESGGNCGNISTGEAMIARPAKLLFTIFVAIGLAHQVLAQYPTISPQVAAQKKAKDDEVDRHSDEAWQRALPAIQEWAKKGKP